MSTSHKKIALLSRRQLLDKGKELATTHFDEWNEGKYTATEWNKILTNEAMNQGLGESDAAEVAEEAMVYLGINIETLKTMKGGSAKKALDELNRAINDGGAVDPRTDKEYDHPWDQKGTEPWTPGQGTELDNVKLSDNVETFAPGSKKKLRDFEKMPERFKDIKNFNRKRRERPAAPRTASQDTHEIVEAGWKKILNAPEYSRYTHPNLPNLVLEVTKWGFTLFTQDTEKGYVALEHGDLSGLDGFLMGLSGTGKFAAEKEALYGRDVQTKPNRPKKYPDSAVGAIAFLKDESTLDLEGATAKADPSVDGVWKVTTKSGEEAIVYLAGYKDPFGKARSWNDFEVNDQQSKLGATEYVLNGRPVQVVDSSSALWRVHYKGQDPDDDFSVPFKKLQLKSPVSKPVKEVPDDYCQACHKSVANRECAHGLLCDKCDKEVHGKKGAPCDELHSGEYKEPKALHPKWKQDEEDAYQQEEQERADEKQGKTADTNPYIKNLPLHKPKPGESRGHDLPDREYSVGLRPSSRKPSMEEQEARMGRTAEVKMHETPKILPPRDDMRRHIDEDLKKELHDDLHQDDEKVAAPVAPAYNKLKRSPTTPAMVEDIKEPKKPSSYAYDPRMLNNVTSLAEGGAPSWVTGSVLASLKTARPDVYAVIKDMIHCPTCKACVNYAAIVRLVEHLKADHHLGEFAQTVSEEVFKLIAENRNTKRQPAVEFVTGSKKKAGGDGEIIYNFRCPLCKHTPVYRESSDTLSSDPYYCHACNRGFDKPIPVHPDDPAYRSEKPPVKTMPAETVYDTTYEHDPNMLDEITRFGSLKFGGMKIAEFAQLWNNATPRGRCKLLGMNGKPTTVLFFKPWEELTEMEKGLLSNWLRIQKLNPAKAATEEGSYWLDQLAEAEEEAKVLFMKDPNMIDLARMDGVDMETLWQQEKEQYLNLIYDPKP